MRQRLWFIGALAAVVFTAYTLTVGAQTGGALHPYIYGSLVSGGDLTLNSTFNATKGDIFFGSSSTYDEANTRLGIGTTTPDVGLHGVVTSGLMIWNNSEADDTNKAGRWGVEHYDVDEEPFYSVQSYGNSGANLLYLGGGWASGNAATQIQFFTAATTATTTGTERLRITAGGQMLLDEGTDALPAIGALNDINTGINFEDILADTISFSTGGSPRMRIQNTAISFLTDLYILDENILFTEDASPPSAPAANQGYLYLKDNGSGKSVFCAIFNTGGEVCSTQLIQP